MNSTNQQLAASLAVLSAMITPAVLISACGSLILATSQRLGRAIERTRKVSDELEAFGQELPTDSLPRERGRVLYDLLGRLARRTRLLQRAMVRLYLALSTFVGTSVAIGVVSVTGDYLTWLPIVLGLVGAALMLQASVLLIIESQVQHAAVNLEMDWVIRLGRQHAPEELIEPNPNDSRWLRWLR